MDRERRDIERQRAADPADLLARLRQIDARLRSAPASFGPYQLVRAWSGEADAFEVRLPDSKERLLLQLYVSDGFTDIGLRRMEIELPICLRLNQQATDQTLVEVRDLGVTDQPPFDLAPRARAAFVVSPLLDRRPLLSDSPATPARELLARFATIARALHQVHALHVILREALKPSDLFLDPQGRVRAAIFARSALGYAAWSDSKRRGSWLSEDALYLAPEDCIGEPRDQRTNLFNLGSLLYQGLTGAWPFHARPRVIDLMKDIMKCEPAPPSSRAPGLNADIDRVVGRAMARRPEDRPRTALEFAKELEALL